MSLVAYDASSDEDDDAREPPAAAFPSVGPQSKPPSPSDGAAAAPPQRPAPPPAPSRNIVSASSSSVYLPTPSADLPDVTALFASPSLPSQQSSSDHSSRVAAAMADNASRKRESNGYAFQDPRSKFPRVQSAQTRGASNAERSLLIPPQLGGRSNVVTEDISKLFVARRNEEH